MSPLLPFYVCKKSHTWSVYLRRLVFNRFYTLFISRDIFQEFLSVTDLNLENCFASFTVDACIEIQIQIRFHIDYSPIVLSPFLLPAGVLCLINFQLFGPKNYCHHRTDYGCTVRKSSSLHGRNSTPNPKFLGTAAKAYFVCHISPNFQISLIHAFTGCP